MEKNHKKFLTVAPFECAWRKDLKFREAGRGCVAFEAFAHNDVTLVFRENVGSQHYHYKKDNTPHYTVILGSHRNKRLRIEVNGKTVVDVAGVGLCSSSAFQSYWICIYDGLIRIGKGKYPFQNVVFQWLDSNPNCNVQYIGLSSWDKHVGYRNVNVLPLNQSHITMWKHVDCVEHNGDDEEGDDEIEDLLRAGQEYDLWGLENLLESWDLSDMLFIVGIEEKHVPAHKIILESCANPQLSFFDQDEVQLPHVTYPILHAFLQYIYMGQTQIQEAQLDSLRALSIQFEVKPLIKQCEEIIERFKLNKKLFDSGKNIEIVYPSSRLHGSTTFPFGVPINVQKLKEIHFNGKYSDVDIYIDGHGFVARAHKVILSLWSVPLTKMFTNGMSESISSKVCLSDVSPEALKAMLEFMYTGELNLSEDALNDMDTLLLLQLFLLADQFGVALLHQECCKTLLECLSEDSVCSILQVISSIPSCKLIEETCERKFATHFDYCTTASIDFTYLDVSTFTNIVKHPDLTVTSEERVLTAILLWCVHAKELSVWEEIDELVKNSTPEIIFGKRLQSANNLLPCVRFPLLPLVFLKKLEMSMLSKQIPLLHRLVKDAINYIEGESTTPEIGHRFQHRRSSFKELQYIRDGDSNGVLYFAGTAYGEHQWVNPVLSKRITISASSPTSRYTDPKVLASRSYQGTCFAGPRMEDGKKCAWWMVDIGPEHQLMCNYYTMRQDGSISFVRNWNFQGSMDGKTWTNLRIQENDQTMCKAGQFASWPIIGANALLPFRFFRVFLTGPTSDASNPWSLCICFLELYGYFH